MQDLADGVWVWPEDLSHYIKNHKLGILLAFAEFVKSRNYNVSISDVLRDKIDRLNACMDDDGEMTHDPTIWNTWLKTMGEDEHFSTPPTGREIPVAPRPVNISLDDIFGKN